MAHRLSFYFPGYGITDEMIPRVLREFQDWGENQMVICCYLIQECLRNERRIEDLHRWQREFGIRFANMLAPCGPGFDMNTMDPVRRPAMIRDHIRSMELSSEFGSRTYTIHIGAHHYCWQHAKLPELRKLAHNTMEKLVPAARKLQVILAVENNFEPPNSAREVLRYVEPYAGEPYVGVCYDVGHANIMMMPPGKRLDRYRGYLHNAWYETGIIPENDSLEVLKPHIVTTHIHDNDGYGDLHAMPGDGSVNWPEMVAKLKSCPRLEEIQTEVNYLSGINWSGEPCAPHSGYSIKRLVETFRKLGF